MYNMYEDDEISAFEEALVEAIESKRCAFCSNLAEVGLLCLECNEDICE
jgi:hypothetical protein